MEGRGKKELKCVVHVAIPYSECNDYKLQTWMNQSKKQNRLEISSAQRLWAQSPVPGTDKWKHGRNLTILLEERWSFSLPLCKQVLQLSVMSVRSGQLQKAEEKIMKGSSRALKIKSLLS